MATVKFYLSRYVKNDADRGEIQLRFSGNRQFVKRAGTGIHITAANWDAERGVPKVRKGIKHGDNCDEIRDRLNQLTLYLLRCWEQTGEGELKENSLAVWMNDIEWSETRQEVFINGKVTEVTAWMQGSKSQNAEEDAARKREMAKFVNWYFLDAFKHYIDEQQKNGVISEVRHRTYMTCWGIWERMERYQNKRYKVKNLTTSVLYDFRHFILNEYELWETKKVVKGKYKKTQKIVDMPVPKERYKYIYLGYDVIESRGVEQRSLNTVVVHFKYLKAFWHWLIKVQKAKVDDIFATFTMDQSVYGTPFFFSSDDRQKLFEADFSKRPELAVQRDIFVFQSLVGCRIGDLKRLKKSNVVDGKYLQYVAGKTKNKSGKTVIVPLHPTAKIIIARYAHTPDDRLLPFAF